MKTALIRAWVRIQMWLWRAVVKDMMSSVALPEGPAHSHTVGPNRARVLLVGSGGAMGWGVRSHDLALPGALARSLASATGRGVDVDLLAQQNMAATDVVAAVAGAGPHRFDAVVVAIGFNSAIALESPRVWEHNISTMLEGLRTLLGPEVGVVLSGIPIPRLDGVAPWAVRLIRDHTCILELVAESQLRGPSESFAPVHLPVEEFDFLNHATAGYEDWGFELGVVVAPLLRDLARHDEWGQPSLETLRQASVDRVLREGRTTSAAVQRIVEMTRSALGAESAIFTVLDRSTERHVARAASTVVEIPREQSLCHHAIIEPAGMVVEDTLTDSRFRDNPRVTAGSSPLRFYAGFPVESPDGYPVGALCVTGSKPRRAADVNTVLLREFALLIQRELCGSTPLPSR